MTTRKVVSLPQRATRATCATSSRHAAKAQEGAGSTPRATRVLRVRAPGSGSAREGASGLPAAASKQAGTRCKLTRVAQAAPTAVSPLALDAGGDPCARCPACGGPAFHRPPAAAWACSGCHPPVPPVAGWALCRLPGGDVPPQPPLPFPPTDVPATPGLPDPRTAPLGRCRGCAFTAPLSPGGRVPPAYDGPRAGARRRAWPRPQTKVTT